MTKTSRTARRKAATKMAAGEVRMAAVASFYEALIVINGIHFVLRER